jgi:hypothetical protein
MTRTRTLSLAVAVLSLACATARADPPSSPSPVRLGEHPAVLVARRGVPADPNAQFYLHPARLEWSLSRPLESGEHPAVLVAHHTADTKIDPNRFIVGHPAGGAPTTRTQ